MHYIFCVTIFVFLSVISCVEPPLPSSDIIRSPSFYEEIREQDKNRTRVFSQSREIYKGSPQCSSERVCNDICSEIFVHASTQKDCMALPLAQVRRLNGIYKILKNKTANQLQRIRLSDFRVFLNVSPASVERQLIKMGADSAKGMAYWIATDWDAARLFYEEDEEFLILEALFKEIEFTVVSALRSDIKNGASYYQIALEYNNESALDWVHNYFVNFCGNQETCLLSQYCLLNRSHYGGFSNEILDYKPFSEFMVHYMNSKPELADSSKSMDNLNEVCSPFCGSHLSENRC